MFICYLWKDICYKHPSNAKKYNIADLIFQQNQITKINLQKWKFPILK